MHKSLERNNKKENDERKKCKIARKNLKIFFEVLLFLSSYFSSKIAVNDTYVSIYYIYINIYRGR